MHAQRNALVLSAAVLLWTLTAAPAGEIIVAPGMVPAFSLDQPRLSAVLFDGGSVITDVDEEGYTKPVVFDAFIDTGASGSVISNLHVTGYEPTLLRGEILSLGLDGVPAGEFIGYYTETGVGGQEVGDVTRSFTVKAINGSIGAVDGDNYATYAHLFDDYGGQNLWVRRAPGTGEVVSVDVGGFAVTIADPINILGMPIIGQKVMYMDPTPMMGDDLLSLSVMNTHLLSAGDPEIPATSLTLAIRMQNFVSTPPPPEVLPSHAENPMVRHIGASFTDSLGVTRTLTEQEWLFDTGAGNSFISRQTAEALGIIPAGMSLADFITQHKLAGGKTFEVGGIGSQVEAPLVTLAELRITTKDGADELVWKNVDLLVLDAAGLPGVFGMNLLVPSVSLDVDLANLTDLSDLLAIFDTRSAGPFSAIVFDAAAGELRLAPVPEPSLTLLLGAAAPLLLKRRRRSPTRQTSPICLWALNL
ncbi:MAG TPA: hypothetical protein DCX07_11885 [Phycisphaerales bacterium]|nr:hypothetical protein [Phycisphaerales bacterium]